MRISTKVRYGSRALVELYMIQKDSSPVINSVLAKNQNLSLKYLESLMGLMKRAGILTSTRGCKGGYKLSRSPEEITLLDIYTALEGPMAITPCTEKDHHCENEAGCPTMKIWSRMNQEFSDSLQKVTLAEMVSGYREGATE